jgi:hypothetical protein
VCVCVCVLAAAEHMPRDTSGTQALSSKDVECQYCVVKMSGTQVCRRAYTPWICTHTHTRAPASPEICTRAVALVHTKRITDISLLHSIDTMHLYYTVLTLGCAHCTRTKIITIINLLFINYDYQYTYIKNAQTARAHRAPDTATVRTHQQAVDLCQFILFQDFGEEGRGRA